LPSHLLQDGCISELEGRVLTHISRDLPRSEFIHKLGTILEEGDHSLVGDDSYFPKKSSSGQNGAIPPCGSTSLAATTTPFKQIMDNNTLPANKDYSLKYIKHTCELSLCNKFPCMLEMK
jgi:hypothetical protein